MGQKTIMDMYNRPWMLVQNKIRGEGGREIDSFRGVTPAQDIPNGAEAWVGSVTKANGATKDNPYLGCAETILPDGRKMYLFEAIAQAPEKVLGEAHIQTYGHGLGMLVKLLDAEKQFLLQCHPTRPIAKLLWNSEYGKEECWCVLNVRKDVEEPPYILIGFQQGIEREKFEAAYRRGDLQSLEAMCHKIPVAPGENYFIPGGMPHALGVGCFVAEIQEPSDLTAVPISQQELLAFRRRANPLGVFVPEDNAMYEKRMLNSFDYSGKTKEEVITQTKSMMPVIRKTHGGCERLIFGAEHTSFFSCTIMQVEGAFSRVDTHAVQIGIVTEGTGRIVFNGGYMKVKRGDELLFPANIVNLSLLGRFQMILCNPGGVKYYS